MTSVGTVISYPIPLYQNYPINSEFYIPSRFVISSIVLGKTTLVTTTEDNNYVVGQQVRLIIPSSFGCRQLNESEGYVLSVLSSIQVELSIDSLRNVDPFISATVTVSYPQILAIGDVNSGSFDVRGTYIAGSFIDISPL